MTDLTGLCTELRELTEKILDLHMERNLQPNPLVLEGLQLALNGLDYAVNAGGRRRHRTIAALKTREIEE